MLCSIPVPASSPWNRLFPAYSTGQAQLPAVIHLDIPESDISRNRGEIHIKAGYLNGGPYYAVKIVSGISEQS